MLLVLSGYVFPGNYIFAAYWIGSCFAISRSLTFHQNYLPDLSQAASVSDSSRFSLGNFSGVARFAFLTLFILNMIWVITFRCGDHSRSNPDIEASGNKTFAFGLTWSQGYCSLTDFLTRWRLSCIGIHIRLTLKFNFFLIFVDLILVPMIYAKDVLQSAVSFFGFQQHRVIDIFCAGYFVVKKHPHHDARFAWVSQPKRSCRHLLLDHLNLNGGCHDVLLNGHWSFFLGIIIGACITKESTPTLSDLLGSIASHPGWTFVKRFFSFKDAQRVLHLRLEVRISQKKKTLEEKNLGNPRSCLERNGAKPHGPLAPLWDRPLFSAQRSWIFVNPRLWIAFQSCHMASFWGLASTFEHITEAWTIIPLCFRDGSRRASALFLIWDLEGSEAWCDRHQHKKYQGRLTLTGTWVKTVCVSRRPFRPYLTRTPADR